MDPFTIMMLVQAGLKAEEEGAFLTNTWWTNQYGLGLDSFADSLKTGDYRSKEQKGREAPVTEDDIKLLYNETYKRPPTKAEMNDWMTWGQANPDQFQKQSFGGVWKNATKDWEGEPVVEPEKFVESQEMKDYRALIESRIAKVPELTPEMITKWAPKLAEASKPFEDEAVAGLKTEYNVASPYSYGSGGQVKATSNMLSKFAANRMATALALGQLEYGKQYDEYSSALAKKGALAGISDENKWKELSRAWSLDDATRARTQADEDWTKMKSFYEGLAEISKPKEKQWYEYITEPVMSEAGKSFGQKAGQGLSDWIMGG